MFLFCFVLFSSIVIISDSAMLSHMGGGGGGSEFIFGRSFQFCALIFVFDYNLAILPLLVNCKFDRFIFICLLTFLPWISTLYV